MKVKACVRSGECCKASPCGFGHWNKERTQCTHLAGEKAGEHYCGIYEDIIKDPTSVVSPAFGSGCCRTLGNTARMDIIKEKYDGVIPTVEIKDFNY